LKQDKLIAWRKYNGLTQKDMADKLGINWRTYANKERGITQFKLEEMFTIARILNKTLDEVFSPPEKEGS
jgi:DNA-binding XRE family transcriptional regulator